MIHSQPEDKTLADKPKTSQRRQQCDRSLPAQGIKCRAGQEQSNEPARHLIGSMPVSPG
jgi:hypothetical protein